MTTYLQILERKDEKRRGRPIQQLLEGLKLNFSVKKTSNSMVATFAGDYLDRVEKFGIEKRVNDNESLVVGCLIEGINPHSVRENMKGHYKEDRKKWTVAEFWEKAVTFEGEYRQRKKPRTSDKTEDKSKKPFGGTTNDKGRTRHVKGKLKWKHDRKVTISEQSSKDKTQSTSSEVRTSAGDLVKCYSCGGNHYKSDCKKDIKIKRIKQLQNTLKQLEASNDQ